jgi:hypothetical protein
MKGESMVYMSGLEDFFSYPWQGVAGFFGFLIAVGVLFSKWIPGVRALVASMVTWLGEMFTASVTQRLDAITIALDNHINDTDAHRGRTLDSHMLDDHAHEQETRAP